MQQWMVEAGRVFVEPPAESVSIRELDRDEGLRSALGNLFAFDIQTSGNALKDEAEPPVTSLSGGDTHS